MIALRYAFFSAIDACRHASFATMIFRRQRHYADADDTFRHYISLISISPVYYAFLMLQPLMSPLRQDYAIIAMTY